MFLKWKEMIQEQQYGHSISTYFFLLKTEKKQSKIQKTYYANTKCLLCVNWKRIERTETDSSDLLTACEFP